MSALDETLVQVRQRVDRYRGQALGEQNTKSILIEPLLRALGWDVEDIETLMRDADHIMRFATSPAAIDVLAKHVEEVSEDEFQA